MFSIFSQTIGYHIEKKIREIEKTLTHPIESQSKTFHHLISKGIFTEWGKKYDYKSITDYNDFKNRIEIQDYNTLKPYIEQAITGISDVLWPGKVKWFAKSSGTTQDKSKYIPVTKDSLYECHFKAGKELIAHIYHNKPDCQIHLGSGLALGGSHSLNVYNEHSRIGDLSAILLQNLPRWAKYWQQPSLKTALMQDWEEKIERMAEEVMSKCITHITGVPTWTVILLNRIMELTGVSNISEVWPKLELYVHGGVNFSPYRKVFENLIPRSDMFYLETYNASEGFFGIQDRKDHNDLLLLLDHGIFYEFIKQGDTDYRQSNAISLEEVETGQNYAMIISTNGGLWRYLIGDTIRFTSVRPYRFRLTGRTKNFINAFGEELVIENAEKAIAVASAGTGSSVADYTAAPLYFSEKKKNGAHEWLIEFRGDLPDMESFVNILDQSLKEFNSDYEAKRFRNIALGPPNIIAVPEGTFYNWLKTKGKLGGQHKVPRLSNDRSIVDEIKSLLEI